jgi:hypothetical protein
VGSFVALTRASRSFGNFDCVPFTVKKFKEARPLTVPLNWTGAYAVGYQYVPDFFNFPRKEYGSGAWSHRVFRNENYGMGLRVELESDTILASLLGGGELSQTEFLHIPGGSGCNISYRNIGWLRYC